MNRDKYCDGIERRDFLKIGALTGGALSGLSLTNYLQMAEAGAIKNPKREKAAIFVRLAGGPSHMDTFDLKPDAPSTHRGEFKPIKTNVSGVEISELMPRLAKQCDKFSIIRGVSHNLAAHELGSLYMNTGNRPLPSLRFPTYGAVISKELESPRDLPPYVAVPNQSPGPLTGYLGLEYGPLSTGATPRAGQNMRIRGLSLGNGVTLEDIERRQNLIKKYDTAFSELEGDDEILNSLNKFDQRVYDMLRSKRTRDAFNLQKEPESISKLFTEHPFAQSCLLATRLVEAGVRFVTVQLGGWDTHQDNFTKLKEKLPELDAGLAGLFAALSAKGLLDTTSVLVTGEFGRTPKINANAGRDHYPRAMTCLLGGGGMKGGQVVGASDELGSGPKETGFTPDDIASTFYHSLGINPEKEYHTPSGRPVMIVRYGKKIKEVLS